MTRIVTLHLDGFIRSSLDRLANRQGDPPVVGVRTAILYYLSDRDDGRVGWRAPRFPDTARRSSGEEVALDDETWSALEAEAVSQGVAPSRLAEHAVLFYLADLQSGLIAERLGTVLDEGDGR